MLRGLALVQGLLDLMSIVLYRRDLLILLIASKIDWFDWAAPKE